VDTSNTVPFSKIAAAASLIQKQASLIRDLHSARQQDVKTAAALTQAVRLAQDGLIDVSDIFEHARQLVKTGSANLGSPDDIFDLSPGELEGVPQTPGATPGREQLDPFTSFLRTLPQR
jgi:hypothetical protein